MQSTTNQVHPELGDTLPVLPPFKRKEEEVRGRGCRGAAPRNTAHTRHSRSAHSSCIGAECSRARGQEWSASGARATALCTVRACTWAQEHARRTCARSQPLAQTCASCLPVEVLSVSGGSGGSGGSRDCSRV